MPRRLLCRRLLAEPRSSHRDVQPGKILRVRSPLPMMEPILSASRKSHRGSWFLVDEGAMVWRKSLVTWENPEHGLSGPTESADRPLQMIQPSVMRSVISALATLLISLSTVAAADDRQDCRRGSVDLRIGACTAILQSHRMDFDALANRGMAYRWIGQFDRAVIDLGEAMRLDPNNAGLYLERGLAYQGRGDNKSAIADLTEAIGRDHRFIEAYFGRALAYETVGRPELATADLDEAIHRDRNMVAALYIRRGDALRTARQYDKAVAAFDKAIELNPLFQLAYYGRGASYDEKGDQDQAAADYRKFLEFEAKTDLVRQRQQVARERLENLSRP
jgi:tetratricopeptide (TPR) repeat protein